MTVRNAGPRDLQVLAIGLPGVHLDEPLALVPSALPPVLTPVPTR